MDAPDEAAAQPLVLQLDVIVSLDPTGGLQLVVKALDLQGSQLVQLDTADAGDDMFFDVVAVIVCRLLPDVGLGVGVEP